MQWLLGRLVQIGGDGFDPKKCRRFQIQMKWGLGLQKFDHNLGLGELVKGLSSSDTQTTVCKHSPE